MLPYQVGAAGPKEPPKDEGNDENVIKLAGDRDEVRNEIDRHGEVPHEREKQEFLASRDALIAHQPPEEHDAVRDGAGQRSGFAAATGEEEKEDEQQPQRDDHADAEESPLPPSHYE